MKLSIKPLYAILLMVGCGVRADVIPQSDINYIEQKVDGICSKVTFGGETTKTDLTVEAKAEITGLLRKLTEIGVKVDGNYSVDNYEGFVQNELLAAYKTSLQCRENLFYRLLDIFILPQLKPTQEVRQPSNADITELRVCYLQRLMGWSAAYNRSGIIDVHGIKCGSKDVKDPKTCGFPATLEIPVKLGIHSDDSPSDGQEKFISVVSNTCSPGDCCRFDMDNKDKLDRTTGNYIYYWRHRSCATRREITIQLAQWQATGKYKNACSSSTIVSGRYFEFQIPGDTEVLKIYPIKPEVLAPESIETIPGSKPVFDNSYNISCTNFGYEEWHCTLTRRL